MKKQEKNTELDFLYKEEKNKKANKVKRKNVGAGPVSAQQNNKNNQHISPKSDQKNKNKNDINVGAGTLKSTKKNKKANKNKQHNKKDKQNKKHTFFKTFIKWTILIGALITSFIFFMMSPLFNVSEIEVVGNDKINLDTIKSLSKIQIGENIYKISSKKIKSNIKENAYIDNVTIKRKLPNKILLEVKERKATYMLEYGSTYAYINNQGYILEISEEKLNAPIIMGYSTEEENIKVGTRLNDKDLERFRETFKNNRICKCKWNWKFYYKNKHAR